MPLTIARTMKFDMDSLMQDTSVAETGALLSARFSSADCSCDNMVMESHYRIYFSTEALAARRDLRGLEEHTRKDAYYIERAEVDIVYGKSISSACGFRQVLE